MEPLIVLNFFLGLISIASAGGLHLDFGVNLPPFVLHMPRFNLPPIKIAATFKPSTGSSPFAIKFPGISIQSNQGHQQDSWWNQNQAWPEPEPEVEPYPESEPEPEPEPESEPEPEPEYHSHHGHSHHSYDPWGKSAIKVYQHNKHHSHKSSGWSSRARMSGNSKSADPTQHIYMKQQSSMPKTSVLTSSQHEGRQKSIVNAHMAAIRGATSSSASVSSVPQLPSSPIDKSRPTAAEVDSWLSQLKSLNTISDQYELDPSANPADYDRRRSSNAHHSTPGKLLYANQQPMDANYQQQSKVVDQVSSSSATIQISGAGNNKASTQQKQQSANRVHPESNQ